MTATVPNDPRLDALMRKLMGRPHVRDFFGFDLMDYALGTVTLGLDYRLELGHLQGWFQGTVTTAIAESAAAMSGATTAPDRDSLTLQQSIHFTGAARGERLVAEGRVISTGRRISTTAADVYVVREGQKHLCACLTMTMSHRNVTL